MLLAVAFPTPAGKASNQKRKRQASDSANFSASVGDTSSACPTMHVCSVSSLTIPRLNTNECRKGGSPNILSARRRDSISRGIPRASPTAVPISAPAVFCSGPINAKRFVSTTHQEKRCCNLCAEVRKALRRPPRRDGTFVGAFGPRRTEGWMERVRKPACGCLIIRHDGFLAA